MMLASSEGMGINFECAPDESFAVLPDSNGLIVHANHWQHAAALSKLKDTGTSWSPDSFYRDYRVKEKLQSLNRKLNSEDLKDCPCKFATLERIADVNLQVCQIGLSEGCKFT